MNDWMWIAAALASVVVALAVFLRMRRSYRKQQAVMEQRLELRDLSSQYPFVQESDDGPVYPLLLEHVTGGEVMLGWTWITVRPDPSSGLPESLSIPWADVLHVYSGIGDLVYIVMEEGERLALPFQAGRDVWARIRQTRSGTPRHFPALPGASAPRGDFGGDGTVRPAPSTGTSLGSDEDTGGLATQATPGTPARIPLGRGSEQSAPPVTLSPTQGLRSSSEEPAGDGPSFKLVWLD